MLFDISASELLLTALVGFLVLGKEDFKSLIEIVADLKTHLTSYLNQLKNFINNQLEDEEIVEIIFDDEGNPHKSYNIEKLKPLFKKSED
jgi:Sec-independent protein translocase protein TatA